MFNRYNQVCVCNVVTTDVQSVSVNKENDTTYSIKCSYISGSDARGCVFILVGGVEGVANITGIINRTSSERVLVELISVDNIIELLVFDLENDNTTGNLSTSADVNSIAPCIDIGEREYKCITLSAYMTFAMFINMFCVYNIGVPSSFPIIGVVAGIVVMFIVFTLAVVVTSILLYLYKRGM